MHILKGSWRSPVVHRLHFENHCIKCSEGFIAKSNLILDIKMHACLCVCSVSQSRLTLCHPIDCSPPDSSVHRISKARKLEWVAISSCRGSSQPRHQNCVSCITSPSSPVLAGRFFTTEPPGKPRHNGGNSIMEVIHNKFSYIVY